MKKPIGFLDGRIDITLVLLFLTVIFTGCSVSRSESLTGEQLQTLVNQQFLSPQIRKMEVLPPFLNVQLYLETPQLTIRGDNQPLGFSINGTLDADVFSDHVFKDFVEGGVTDPVPFRIEGAANLEYRPDDHSFYFSNVQLESAHIDLDVAMIQTLIIDQLKKALKQELGSVPIIPLDMDSSLYKQLKNLPASVQVQQGKLVISRVATEIPPKSD